jgi:Na+-transporting NADH:ubiquinone oxidoreductase subunit NqrF
MPDVALLLVTYIRRNCTAVGAGGSCTQRMSTVTKAADTSDTVQVSCTSQHTCQVCHGWALTCQLARAIARIIRCTAGVVHFVELRAGCLVEADVSCIVP